ncbi:MAG: hypothetical protein ACFB00_11655 [Parvularculaceae bacterium]
MGDATDKSNGEAAALSDAELDRLLATAPAAPPANEALRRAILADFDDAAAAPPGRWRGLVASFLGQSFRKQSFRSRSFGRRSLRAAAPAGAVAGRAAAGFFAGAASAGAETANGAAIDEDPTAIFSEAMETTFLDGALFYEALAAPIDDEPLDDGPQGDG